MRKSIFNRIGVGMAACVAIGAIALAGCGGGSSSSSTGASGASGAAGSTPLSQAEFVSQANAVCKDVNDKITALKAPTSSDLSAQAIVVKQEVTAIAAAVTKLSVITPPSGDLQSKYSAWLGDIKNQVALAAQVVSAAQAGDTSKAQTLAQQLQANNDKANSQATAMGLTECAKDAQPQG